MLNVFSDLKSLLKISQISIDNFVFKLHYKFTVSVLLIFSVIVNGRQFFGDPIDCTDKANHDVGNIVDTYCWFNSYNWVHKGDGRVKFYGLDPNTKDFYVKRKQGFYQWIGIILALQAVFFYVPRFIWKQVWEEGRIKELVTGLVGHIHDTETYKLREGMVVGYISENRTHHMAYAFKFFLCEVLNFVNSVCQIMLTDWFLGHMFLNYGISWLFENDIGVEEAFPAFHRAFPTIASCEVKTRALSPERDVFNVIYPFCVLPLHVFNEKIYLYLWFHFVILAIVSALVLVYRAALIFLPYFRYFMLQRRCWGIDRCRLRKIVDSLDYGDWFLLYQMRKNMDPVVFSKLLEAVETKLLNTDGIHVLGRENSRKITP